MEVRVSDVGKSERDKFLVKCSEILDKTEGPLRLGSVVDRKNHQQVLFLRERTWGEFFLEKLIMTPEKMEDIENEALAALELAFLTLTDEAECGSMKSEGKGGRGNLVDPEDSWQPRLHMNDDDVNGCGKDQETDWNVKANSCKELLRSRILKESELKFEKNKYDLDVTSSKKIKASHGLVTVPKGISVSICPALQVVAHNTVVSNVKVGTMPKGERFSPIKRARQAFEDGWGAVSRRLPVMPANLYSVPLTPGLRHIENLFCFADNSKRTANDVLANNDSEFWRNFYLKPCRRMKGSIVMGLYPDFYSKDKYSGVSIPFYSSNNIKGVVDAAIELSSKKRWDNYEPVSFMFAEIDAELAEAIAEEIKNRQIESPNSVKTETYDGKRSQGQANQIATSIGAVELTGINEKVEERKNGDNISPERNFVLGQLQEAKDKMKKASAQKNLQEISARLSNLPKEDLAAVLGNLDKSILYESFKQVSLPALGQTTPTKSLRPTSPDNLPTLETITTLRSVVRQAIVSRKEHSQTGNMVFMKQNTPSEE